MGYGFLILFISFFIHFFILICLSHNFVLGAAHDTCIDYEREYATSVVLGKKWYAPTYIPSRGEIEGVNKPRTIKVRLPCDLRRIFMAYHVENIPVSLAVACGDKELGMRSRVASFYDSPDRPNGKDFSENDNIFNSFLSEEISENFISIDPVLGIGRGYHADQRGAGHMVMDALNAQHWSQLGEFLSAYKIKISQIIFTSIVNPEHMLIHNPRVFNLYMGLLKDKGHLVNPYFSYWSDNCAYVYDSFKRDLFYPKLQTQNDFVIDGFLGALFSSPSNGLFYGDNALKMPIFSRYTSFLKLAQGWKRLSSLDVINAKEWLQREISCLIDQKCEGMNKGFCDFILSTGMYYVSIFNMDGLKEEKKLSSSRKFFDETREQQMRYLFPLYKKMYASFGCDIEFLTNARVSKAIEILDVVSTQNWKKGDYPYGERNHIALVMKKYG